MNRIDRLFGILLRLQRAGRIRAQDLARHFEVSERTIYRDIAALNELGVPIISLPNAGYELPAGFSLPPLFFAPGEAAALALAVQLLLAQTTGATSQDAERALMKIAAILPRELRARVDELSAVVRFYANVADEADGVLRYAVTDPAEMLPWLLSWGANAEVLEPEALRERVREEMRRLLVESVPGAVERVAVGWQLIGYRVPGGRRRSSRAGALHSGSAAPGKSYRDALRLRFSGRLRLSKPRWFSNCSK
jgi:predicted DNA-binding transcriptional regulator YafY